jgi:hypothetical protein
MPYLSLTCPHCRTEKIGFAPRGAVGLRPGTPISVLFLQCEGCGHGVIADVRNSPANSVTHWINGIAASPGELVKTYPELGQPKCPADVPSSVQSAYLSGLDNLHRNGGTNAAAMMFRRSIEIAAKIINQDAPKGDNLKKRIQDLSADFATPAMKEWAQHIRLDANDAAHELEEFSAEDAEKLHIFAEMFLTYAFTLPAMLKRATQQVPTP